MPGMTTLLWLSCITVLFRACFALLGKSHGFASLDVNHASIKSELIEQCEERWFQTRLDHFSWAVGPPGPHGVNGTTTFPLRYFVCDKYYREADDGSDGPIFFYLGNEADVLLYLNATGLMWENAESFGALLIFAEHRYYGKSLPFGDDCAKHMQWLTSEQALADYARLIDTIQDEKELNAPVIGFGGSYGGMLATWGRIKYPHIWAGVIAGSAPIWTFEGMHPDLDPSFFAKGVTRDATEDAGAAEGCADAIHDAWAAMMDLAEEEGGLSALSDALRICPAKALNSTQNVTDARDWMSSAFDYLAMGNYPYPSSYMLNGNGQLPAFPMRVACDKMMAALDDDDDDDPDERLFRDALGRKSVRQLVASSSATRSRRPSKLALLDGLASAVGVWYNFTGSLPCFNPWQGVNEETQHDGDFWGWQYCTEQFMPMSKTGVHDMFWDAPFNESAAVEACVSSWGARPRVMWGSTEWGGRRLDALTNVVFSNGLLDPWHGGGVLHSESDSVKVVVIPEGAHHLDLMFSHQDDPDSVKDAREDELDAIADWIDEFRSNARTWRARPHEA